jgi:hypothetical protein
MDGTGSMNKRVTLKTLDDVIRRKLVNQLEEGNVVNNLIDGEQFWR